jgi:acyl phosphate:glycerol-3-phosphate acyltransferase
MSDVGLPPSFGYFVFAMLAAILVVAYLIGSIPFGYLIARVFYHTDIRKSSSAIGRRGMVAVLILDAAKGFAPVLAVRVLTQPLGDPIFDWFVAAVAAAAVLGHCFSPWMRFKSANGVATSFGAVLGFCWPAGLVAIAVWIAGTMLTRYPSVGSMLGSLVAPVAIWFFTESPALTLYGAFAALLILFMHRENIAKLRAGTETPLKLFNRQSRAG